MDLREKRINQKFLACVGLLTGMWLWENQAQAAMLPADNPGNTRSGLVYQYYEFPVFDMGLVSVFNLETKATLMTVGVTPTIMLNPVINRREQFGYIFSGYIAIPTDSTYTFSLTSDKGSVLFLNNTKIIDNDGGHLQITKTGSVELAAGLHAMQVYYYQEYEIQPKVLVLRCTGPGINWPDIPADAMCYSADEYTTISLAGPGESLARGETAKFSIVRDSANQACDLAYTLLGTAEQNVDYLSPGLLHMNAGQSSLEVSLPILRPDFFRGEKTLEFKLKQHPQRFLQAPGSLSFTLPASGRAWDESAAGQVTVVGGEKGYIRADQGEQAHFIFTPSASGSIVIRIFTPDGAKVKTLESAGIAGQRGMLSWDADVPTGMYLAVITGPGLNYKRKLVVVR